MNNGGRAEKGNAARATAFTGPHKTLAGTSGAQDGGGLAELPFDDPMDAGIGLGVAQISQAQIIESQAETIARLERHAARDQEYRTVTKVKLKEAAQRLKEYRLRVEALMEEVDAAKAAIANLEAASKKAQAAWKKKSVVVAPKKPETKTVGVQTPWKKAMRTVSVQTMGTSSTNDAKTQVEKQLAASAFENAVRQGLAVAIQEKIMPAPVELAAISKNCTTTEAGTENAAFDAVGAAIDAELDFSDDDQDGSNHDKRAAEDSVTATRSSLLSAVAQEPLAVTPLVLADAISREIDKELELSSSSSSDDSSDDELGGVVAGEDLQTQANGSRETIVDTAIGFQSILPADFLIGGKKGTPDATVDAVSAAIDAELASDSEDDDERHGGSLKQPLTQNDDTPKPSEEKVAVRGISRQEALPVPMPLSLESGLGTEFDLISGEIDANLASSSEDEDDPAALAVNQKIKPPTNADELVLTSDSSGDRLVASRSGDAAAGDKGIGVREINQHILQEKSRTLSLSTDSSSSDSSDGEISETVCSAQEQDSFAGPSPSSVLSATIDHVTTKADAPAGGAPDPDSDVHDKNTAQNKRRGDDGDHVDPNATVEPDLKKRKLELHEETPTIVPTKPARQDGHVKGEMSRTAPVVGVLAPRDLVAFKVAITLREGESPDSAYVTRTLGVLVKQAATLLRASGSSSNHVAAVDDNPHVSKLCKSLNDEHTNRQVSYELLVEAMLRIFRTPRTRHAIDKSIVVLGSLFQIVLFLRLGYGDLPGRVGEVKLGADMVPELHQCLLALRKLVVYPRLKDGLLLSSLECINAGAMSVAAAVAKPVQIVSHDKAFLAHVAAFYSTICRALDRFDLLRVFLVDILMCHPNIKGLYCAHAIVQVNARVLRKRWNARGQEQQSALRAVLVHVLQVITHQSREKQEVVYRESALSLLSSIAEWIDDPNLASLNPPGNPNEVNDLVRSITATIWRAHVVRSLSDQENDVFDVSKAIELLAAFHGDAVMVNQLPVSKFLTFDTSHPAQPGIDELVVSGRQAAQVAQLISAVARGTLRSCSSHRDGQGRALRQEHCYVDQAIRWMLKTCPREESCNEELLSVVVSELTDLLIGLSADESMCKQRDDWLLKLLQNLSPRHLQCLPGQPLRQLRLLVMVARPLATP